MTKEEARRSLFNTKVYVDGKSKEIQEKLFELGAKWDDSTNERKASFTHKPFLFLDESLCLSHVDDMNFYKEHKYHEVSADYILNLKWNEESIFESKIKELEEELSKTQYKRYSEGITIIIPANDSADKYYHAIEKSIKQITGKPKTASDLKPFDRVLVRDRDNEKWIPDFFQKYSPEVGTNYSYYCIGDCYAQCIPYEGNEDKLK
jgi:hypothetical protein